MIINKIIPDIIDNNYHGNKLALYVFYFLTMVTVVRSCIHLFAADGGAQSIATIPLDAFPTTAADTVIFVFALWGLSQLLFALFYVIVAVKIKSMIPLMYLFILVEYLGRLGIGLTKSLTTTGTAPGSIGNYIFISIASIMLFLTLRNKGDKSQS